MRAPAGFYSSRQPSCAELMLEPRSSRTSPDDYRIATRSYLALRQSFVVGALDDTPNEGKVDDGHGGHENDDVDDICAHYLTLPTRWRDAATVLPVALSWM
jgi:hypothetical protein